MLIEDWLRSWNAVSAPITNLGVCLDTHEEALRYKALQERQGWILQQMNRLGGSVYIKRF